MLLLQTVPSLWYISNDNRYLVRVSAKELTALIMDEERLRSERSDRRNWKSRVTGIDEYGSSGHQHLFQQHSGDNVQKQRPDVRRQRVDEEDAEYRLAIEASKYEAEEDRKRREKNAVPDDDDLAKAIKLSKEEEELRRRELEESSTSIFDEAPL